MGGVSGSDGVYGAGVALQEIGWEIGREGGIRQARRTHPRYRSIYPPQILAVGAEAPLKILLPDRSSIRFGYAMIGVNVTKNKRYGNHQVC